MMDPANVAAWGQVGAISALTFAAIGSALGAGAAGSAAVGAWKRCFVQNKQAPFQLSVFVGAPLSQTIYGLLLMIFINGAAQRVAEGSGKFASSWPFVLWAGVLGGIAMGFSAWMQGRAGAGACDAFAETRQGFTNNLLVLGIIETVALFVMVFIMMMLP